MSLVLIFFRKKKRLTDASLATMESDRDRDDESDLDGMGTPMRETIRIEISSWKRDKRVDRSGTNRGHLNHPVGD